MKITAVAPGSLPIYLKNQMCFSLFTLIKISGPSCSKLTKWLVNVLLKFKKLISQICQYFLLKKCEKQAPLIFLQKIRSKLLSFFQHKISVYLVIKS